MVTRCLWSLYDAVDVLLEACGPRSTIAISTWTMSPLHMERIRRMLDYGAFSNVSLIIDQSFVSRQPQYVSKLRAVLGNGLDVRMTKTHAKFICLAGNGYHFTLRSSANYNQSARLENVDLDEDKDIYTFFRSIVDEVRDVVPAGIDADGATLQVAWNRLWPVDGAVAGDDARDYGRGAGDDDVRRWLKGAALPRPAVVQVRSKGAR